MKFIKLISFFTLLILVFSCNSTASNNGSKNSKNTNFEQTVEYKNGLLLTAQFNCNTCHAVNETLTGPSFKEIANKYQNNDENIEKLTTKVINGTVGVWGKIPMIAHKNLSPIDAKKMINYIFLLKNE